MWLFRIIISFVALLNVTAICNADTGRSGQQQRELLNIRQKINPDVRGLFNAERNHYTSVYGRLSFPRTGDKRVISEQFLNRHSALLNLRAFSPNFKLIRTVPSVRGGPTYFIYQQHYNGMPISGAVLSIAISEDGVVRSVNTAHRSILPTDLSVVPKYTESDAKELIKNIMPVSVNWKNKGLYVYFHAKTRTWHLTWGFELQESSRSWENWMFVVDAHTNEVIDKVSLVSFSKENCNPKTKEWVDYSKDISPPPTKEAHICEDNGQYLLYTGPSYKPAEIETYFENDTVAYPISSWPPKDLDDLDFWNLVAHSVLDEVLYYFDSSYEQKSWASCDDKYCPVNLHIDSLTGAFYGGNGNIHLNPSLSPASYWVIGHEFTHALVDGYEHQFNHDTIDYCNKSYPESPGLEEGLADSFGCLVDYYYNKSWDPVCNYSSLLTYQDYLDILNAPEDPANPDKHCNAHEFGQIVPDFVETIIYGSKIETAPWEYVFANLDTSKLLTHNDVGWLLIETLRSKPTWQDNTISFANAVLSTCMEWTESLFDVDECKNVERAFLMKGIDPDVGYDVSLVGAHNLPLHVDLNIAPPAITNIQIKKMVDDSLYIEVAMKAKVEVGSNETVVPAIDKINSGGDISASYDIEDTSYSTTYLSTIKIHDFWEKVNIVKDGFSGDIETKMVLSDYSEYWFGGASNKIYGPLTDYPETFFISVQPLKYYDEEYEPLDPDQSDNTAQFKLGVNFTPMIDSTQHSADPVGGDLFWCDPNSIKWKIAKALSLPYPSKKCFFEWDVTISAINIGNKPTYPVVRADVIPYSSFSDVSGQKNKQRTTKLDKWKKDIAAWKEGGQLEAYGCLPAYDSIILPGESFCVKKVMVTAKANEAFVFIIDGDDRVPELSETDNTLVSSLPFDIGSSGCHSTPLGCAGYFHEKAKESFVIIKTMFGKDFYKFPSEIKYLYGGTDGVVDPLFSFGERVMLPPDKEGNYSSEAFLNPYEDNDKTFKTFMQDEKPNSKKSESLNSQ